MMEYFDFKGKKVAFRRSGGGSPVLFLHGFCEDQSMWTQIEAGVRQGGYQFISMDLPGFGASEVLSPLAIDEMAEVVEKLAQILALKNMLLIGHSMGGYVSLAYAQKFAHRLQGFGLLHSHPYADGEEKKEVRQKSIEFIEKNGSAPYVKQLIPKLFPPEFAQAHPEAVLPLVDKAVQYPEQGIINALRAMKERPDRSTVLEQSEVPVLFIVGKKDELEPQEVLIRQTSLPPLASIHLLEGIGHMGIFEAPETTGRLVVDFAHFCWSKS